MSLKLIDHSELLNSSFEVFVVQRRDIKFRVYSYVIVALEMGPLQLTVTWYKIRHSREQATLWAIQNKENSNLTG